MFVDFASMARELGTRADALRIKFGIPTRLQRLIRGTTTFEEVTALSGEFREDDSYRSCGPKFEEAEKEEYLARRAELFLSYLVRFTTIESFLVFGIAPHGDSITYGSEEAKASEKLCELLREEIARAETLTEGKLERLVEIHTSALKFVGEQTRFYSYIFESLHRSIRRALNEELKAARVTKTVAETVLIFKKLGPNISAVDLRDRWEKSDSYPWRSLWDDAATLEDVLLIEREVPQFFLDKEEIERILVGLVKAAVEETSDFNEAMTLARQFAERDSYGVSPVYSQALTSAAEKAETEAEVLRVIKAWEDHRFKPGGLSNLPGLPGVVYNKWDALFLETAKTEQDLQKLAKLMERSPQGSETRRVAGERLEAHFEALMAEAESEAEMDQIEETAKALSGKIYLSTYRFKSDLRYRRHAEQVQELWEAVERGDPVEDEKRVLIGLYHEFKERDPERARMVLLKLARHFPAEVVDEVPTEA